MLRSRSGDSDDFLRLFPLLQEERYSHVGHQHLGQVLSKLLNLLEHHGYQETTGLNSLLGSGVKRSVEDTAVQGTFQIFKNIFIFLF